MISREQAQTLLGQDAFDVQGEKVGEVVQAFLDDDSGQPKWATVRTGLLGSRDRVVPLSGATATAEGLALPYEKGLVKEAPDVDIDNGHLDPTDEQDLYAYYEGSRATGSVGFVGDAGYAQAPVADDDTAVVTRSEERIVAGVETVVGGRARLEKYVVTETETVTVQVRREKVRLVNEPVEEGDTLRAPADGTEFTNREQVFVLYAERPVVTLEAVPVERVRVLIEPETVEQTVSAPVRKERVELTTETTAQPVVQHGVTQPLQP